MRFVHRAFPSYCEASTIYRRINAKFLTDQRDRTAFSSLKKKSNLKSEEIAIKRDDQKNNGIAFYDGS